MLTAWFQHPAFGNLVSEAWADQDTPLMTAMETFRRLAIHWNRTCFGNIFEDKRRCSARLSGVQRRLELYHSPYLARLESQLLQELNTLLRREEEFWRQKANVQWLRGGEQNSRFFHTSAILRRKRTSVEQLKGVDGLWCDDPATLEQWAVDFYQKLYTSEGSLPYSHSDWSFPSLSHAERRILNRDVLDGEITIALSQMAPDKAAGPDGFLPRFF